MKPSVIERSLSSGWKGILILLIVLGHNSLLCKFGNGESDFYEWRAWIYTFHVWAFFILPFMYGCKEMKLIEIIAHVRKNAIKLLVPYLWMSIICVSIYRICGGVIDLPKVLLSFFVGSQWMTSTYMGFHFLWFLPTILMVMIIRDVYYHSCLAVKSAICLLACFLWVAEYVPIHLGWLNYIPLNFTDSMKYAWVGICSRALLDVALSNRLRRVMVLLVFILATVVFFIKFDNDMENMPSILKGVLFLVLPVTFGNLVVFYKKNGNNKVLQMLGKYSLQIYLFHVMVYNILLRCILHFVEPSMFVGLILLILTLCISLVVGVMINRYRPVKALLFP